MADQTELEGADGTSQRRPGSVERTRIEGDLQPAAYQPLPPSLVEKGYRRGELLGSGGEATVYLCTDPMGTQVAVKVYKSEPKYTFDIAAIQRNSTPRWTVRIMFSGRDLRPDCDIHYEVMEYCAGGSLARYLKRFLGGCDYETAIDILRQLTGAIKSIQGDHAGYRLVHGDIKPGNILIRRESPLELVLADFGLIADLGDRSVLTNYGHGSPPYMAPEFARFKRTEADWWSLGMVMFRVLVGQDYYRIDGSQEMSREEIDRERSQREVTLTAIDRVSHSAQQRDRWKLLLAGLLTKDVDHRWGATEVEQWLTGGRPAVHRIVATIGPEQRADAPASQPWAWAGVGEFHDPRALGEAMARQPAEAARMLTGNRADKLRRWLIDQARTGDSYSAIGTHKTWGPAERACYFVAQLVPGAVLVYRDHALTGPADLRDLAQSQDDAAIGKLYETELLAALATEPRRANYRMVDANWHDLVDRALDQARDRGIPVSPQIETHLRRESLRLAAADDQFAADYVAEVSRKLGGTQLSEAHDTVWFARLVEDARL